MSENSFPEFVMFFLFLTYMGIMSVQDELWLITSASIYGFLGAVLSIYYKY